ncbi:MAG: SDR family oxidoreductase [Nannocystaceae bacterium]|nr:SDR family oxidoreductase [Nannocystaceae bacterium]
MTHVIVTGASSGIGRALVREYIGAGAAVTAVARRAALLQELVDELGSAVHPVVADLSDPAQATAWLPAAVAACGPVDVLVNNAGVQIVARTIDVSIAQMRALFEVDLLTPLALIQAVLPEMLARDRGAIVNLASVAALAPTPGMTHYSGAKAGLGAASEVLRGELRDTGVTVVTVYPGPVDTPMARAAYDIVPPTAAVKLLPEGVPAVLAHRIRRAVERRRARIIYPWVYTLTRHTPAITRFMMDRFTPLPPPRAPAA